MEDYESDRQDLELNLKTLGFHIGECARIAQELREKPEPWRCDRAAQRSSYKVCVNKVISECERIILNSNDHDLVFRIENIFASYNIIRDRINR
jgi:hypothetical protein